jgi:hypothetical protein
MPINSVTIVDTVGRVSVVARAMSARLIEPAW